jgi:glyoxylase-like metal-dependent hydrolase (beta-lactamase superfamily II)
MRRTSTAHLRVFLPPFGAAAKNVTYQLKGSPIRIGGRNEVITHELLSTKSNAVTNEPMKIHALSGYVSVLYACEYPERPSPNCMLLDCGTWTDADRIAHYLAKSVPVVSATADDIPLPTSDPTTPAPSEPSSSEAAPRSDTNEVLSARVLLAVATHAHPDHCGAAPRYAAYGIGVGAPKNIDRYYAGWRGTAQLWSERLMLSLFAYMLGRQTCEWPMMTGKCPATPTLPSLSDGASLPCGFDDWTSIACHGHTGHMIGLFHGASGIFYAADFVICHKRRFMGPMPTDMPEEYLVTIERLRGLPVRWLLLAHGGIVDMNDLAGGWQFVLDAAAAHCRAENVAPAVRLVRPIACLSGEPAAYNPAEDRVRGPLKLEKLDPVAVMHLK